MGCLAFDTSNYTTSVAYYDGVQAVSCAKLLDVAPGQLGLRQSDALFAQAAEAVAQEMIARTGVRWSTAYKQPALTAVVVQTLHDAWEMAK